MNDFKWRHFEGEIILWAVRWYFAEGHNLGLRKMAEASNTHDYWQLSRLSRWHVESDAAAQGRLPMSQFWAG